MFDRLTEQRLAYNKDRIAEFTQRGVQYIEWHAQPDCCEICNRMSKNADGSHKRFAIDAIYKGRGTNQGFLKKDWSPDVWLLHYACRCRPVAVYV